MSPFDQLQRETAAARADFLAIPILQRTTQVGVSRPIYLDFLGQAYHHVRHTHPLLTLAASRCDSDCAWLGEAYRRYAEEEHGHEAWILDDIATLGGDIVAVSAGSPRGPCGRMVRQAYDAIDRDGPVSLLGMIYVLEGMSVLLAQQAATTIQRRLNLGSGDHGFRYLTSHGALDRQHITFYRTLVDRIVGDTQKNAVIRNASVMYGLYGDVFREIEARAEGDGDEA